MAMIPSSSLIISNTAKVQILNATFINCGCTVIISKFTTPNNLFPSVVMTAITLYNSHHSNHKHCISKQPWICYNWSQCNWRVLL